MKKLLICLALTVTTVSANAQQRFNKGDWFLGAQTASLGVNYSFGKEMPSQIYINLDGTGGWFFADKFAAEALAGFSYIQSGEPGPDYTSMAYFAVGVGLRYYPVANLFARLGYKGQATSGSNFMSSIEARVGYDIFISKKVFFEPAVYFEKNINKAVLRRGADILGLSLGFGVKF